MPADTPARGYAEYAPVPHDPDDARRYAVVQALRTHTYDYRTKGSRPDDPGWHMCRCGEWAGYWCDFYDEHLAPEILKVLGDVTDV